MNRQVAFAYAIAGLAVAVALIAVVGSRVGLFETRSSFQPAASEPPGVHAPHVPGDTPASSTAPSPGAVLVSNGAPITADGAEIVYVDAPPRARHDDDDEHERHEGRHHREDDDD